MKNKIIAHRGASNLAHENTLEAFQKAIDLGVGGIELDVRRTKDGELICFHDASIENQIISKLDFAQVNALAVKKNFLIPKLSEALALIKGKAYLQIEIKELGYEAEVGVIALSILRNEEFSIISFNLKSLLKVKSLYPQIKVGLILGSRGPNLIKTTWFIVFQKFILKKIDFLALNYNLYPKITDYIGKQVPITLWTVDDAGLISGYIKDARIMGVTTNFPEVVLKK